MSRFLTPALLFTLVLATALPLNAQVPPTAPLPPSMPAPAAMPSPTPMPTALPGVDVTAPAAASIDTLSGADASPAQTSIMPSIGDSNVSLFFTPNQIKALRDGLAVYEGKRGQTQNAEDMAIGIEEEQPKKDVSEPPTYPIFYLSSIVYHSPKDWSIWVSGHKITSQKNTTTLAVIGVSAERASFMWTPPFTEAFAKRYAAKLFAPVDEVKNKLTSTQSFHYDPKTGVVTFSLLTNQSFVPGYLNTFEGMVETPKLEPLPTAGANEADKGAGVPLDAAPLPPTPEPAANSDVLRKQNQGLADDSISALVDRFKKK